ncbi:uncharacterized protein PHACADRAFT_259918 [Phanerochaete carnosa HHB-10118-sp]|uniref:Major facilitator superfamily (MFS) profile domain-containing protein n=1 Tax=Phanerochaete carnosa (strain HHB-10118-sp) TaxID=650164 RepID=K5W2Z1_PHACS|nr:uncharacterized protein PHACADRAFT_259918 [Phanerochaete carnosa HHB-10118-sp]EKM53500.1 hypothetical protein PHACADRAFT_259918 [Phanerochaete carnosa HHB-10118-sp]
MPENTHSPRDSLGSTLGSGGSQLNLNADDPAIPRKSQHNLASATGGNPDEPHSGLPEKDRTSTIPESLRKSALVDDQASLPPKEQDIIVVDWDGPDDPENPKNWPEKKKWASAVSVSLFTFISPLASSMITPAIFQVAEDLHITSSIQISLTISIYILAYAVGPLVLGPLSEIYGRSRLLQLANLIFLIFNLVCGFAKTKGQLIAFRFLSGIGGSAPLSVGGGVLSDMWNADKRGRAVGIYSLAPLLGPAIAPVVGGWIAEKSTWHWVFYSVSIADAVVQLIGMRYLSETYAPVLLQWKADKIRKELAGDTEKGDPRLVKTVYEIQKGEIRMKEFLIQSLCRPFALFFQEPIIQLFGIYLAFVYGTVYLLLTTIPTVFTDVYHEKIGIAGLHYISLGLGLTVSAQIGSRALDRVYRRYKAKNNGVGKPEYRLPPAIVGTSFLPVGLLMTGWSAQEHVHWIVTDIGFAFVGVGSASAFQCLNAYIIDSFPRYAASALASVTCLRSLAGFGFPLFAPYMYKALGFGKGDTILAAFCLVVGSPALILFWIYGERIRGMSRRATTAPPAIPKA